MTKESSLECQVCGFVGLDDGSDGFFYCQRCGSQADGIRDTAVDNDEMLLTKENVVGIIQRRVPVVKPEPFSQSQPLSQFWETLKTQEDVDRNVVEAGDGVGPTEPIDFGRASSTLIHEDYYNEIRMRYVMGLQIMIELQVKALVEKFNVCPIIVGMVEPIWLRFIASTKLFTDDWADEVINESESQVQGETEVVTPRSKHKSEPHNILGKRLVMIWYKSISKTIPLSTSLGISFLVCHLAREPILSTDISKWTLEGKLPYFTAFLEIEKQIGPPTNTCPLSSSRMFRPLHGVSIQRLESLAASIAYKIGLELPPVNFYGIAAWYLGQLSLPVEIILPHACRIYEWSMPPELWLSGNEFRLPTRACVLSILIVSIRMLYKIHGFGKWEKGLDSSSNILGKKSVPESESESELESELECEMSVSKNIMKEDCNKVPKESKLDATKILLLLESKYSELIDTSVDGKDLETYLEYCKNVVFSGVELSFEDHEENQIIEDLWNFYHKKEEEDNKPLSPSPNCSPQKRRRDFSENNTDNIKKLKDENSKESKKEKAIKRMILNMEEKRFCYIPPRSKVKRADDYLHYTRKKGDGNYTYAAHADYYILLRSCARVGRLDVRSMHGAVLSFERRLAWLEKNIDQCVKEMPSSEAFCQFCQQDDDMIENGKNDHDDQFMDFSKLNL